MNERPQPGLSLGPVLYHWSRDRLLGFYDKMADAPVETIYLGETVCSKRRVLNTDEWHGMARELVQMGKDVVLSSLTLIEADSELRALKRQCENGNFLVEANDMAAVHFLERAGVPFVAGATLNLYNEHSIAVLAQAGMRRWVMPVELTRQTFNDIHHKLPEGIQTEVFAYGRLPLAYSARCFTARAHDLPKDDCRLICLEYPDGLPLQTRDDDPFLVLNGIQTQSALSFSLPAAENRPPAGVDWYRISPQSRHTPKLIDLFDQWRHGLLTGSEIAEQIDALAPSGLCNGYWLGGAGMQQVSVAPPVP